jgi:hypothetical protein
MQFSVEFDFVTVFDVFLSGYEKARKNGGSSYGERTIITGYTFKKVKKCGIGTRIGGDKSGF